MIAPPPPPPLGPEKTGGGPGGSGIDGPVSDTVGGEDGGGDVRWPLRVRRSVFDEPQSGHFWTSVFGFRLKILSQSRQSDFGFATVPSFSRVRGPGSSPATDAA